MPSFNESVARRLSPEQAGDLLHVLEIHARWDSLLADVSRADSAVGLRCRQNAHDVFQAAWAKYAAKYPNAMFLEPPHAMPDRVATWCRILLVVLRKAGGTVFPEVMAWVYRVVGRMAERMKAEPVKRDMSEGTTGDLEAIIAWCDQFAPSFSPLGIRQRMKKSDAA